MSCADFEVRIASGETEDPAVAGHISVCSRCREFAHELEENTATLRSLEPDAAAYTALRARVMSAVQPRRRFAWLWAAAAITAAASVALIWVTAPLRVPEAAPPAAVRFRIPAPPPVIAAKAVVTRRKAPVRRPVPQPLQAIKILTDDPNVVIIWLVDEKKGDSL